MDKAGEIRADIILSKADISAGVEISLTTEANQEAENIENFIGVSFTHMLFVSPDVRWRRALAKRFADSNPSIMVSSPENIVVMLDAIDSEEATGTTARGYKMNVTRQMMTLEERASRRSAVAAVIAKSLGKGKGMDR